MHRLLLLLYKKPQDLPPQGTQFITTESGFKLTTEDGKRLITELP